MFLERKFMTARERADARAADAHAGLPEPIRDVVHNIERLLAAERGIGHVLPDYGLSRSGQWSVEGVLVHAAAQLRETLPRYETRFALVDLETDLDPDGRPLVRVRGTIGGARVALTVDPLNRRIHAIELG
jgi:predicted component of type VI protein secretion system